MVVVGGQGRAQGTASVARSRLDPDPLERALAQQPPVGDAVERHSARQAQVRHVVFRVQPAREAQDDLFGDRLDRSRDVHFALGQLGFRAAGRAAEQVGELGVGHRQTDAVVEIRDIQPERSVVLEVDQVVEDEVAVDRLAVGRQAHQLVLARVDLEARVIGEGRIEQAERVGKMDLLDGRQGRPLANADRRRRPFADPVHGQDHGLVERRGIKRAGSVGLMMLGEQQLVPQVRAGRVRPKLPDQKILLEELFA